MSLAGKHNAAARLLEKFRDCLGDTGTGLVHQRFDLHAARESGLFCGPHLRCSQNWQVQSALPICSAGARFRVCRF